MARMFSRNRGKAGSTKPLREKAPTWVKYSAKEVEQLVIKIAKTGKNSSQIGLELRDVYGIPDVKIITKKKIGKILEENKLNPEIPEDLLALVRREVSILKHTENHKHDMVGKRGKQLTEAKIQALAKYYKKTGKLPKDWKFDLDKAKLLIG